MFFPTCAQNRKCCLEVFEIELCSSTFCRQRNWDKLQWWFRGSLNVWQSMSPPLHSVSDNWASFRSRWQPCHTPQKSSVPLPSVIDPLKVPFILQKRIEEHRSSTAPVGCHVAAGVLYPLEWSPCVFVHHTQLDPGTHGSTAPQLLILIKFASFVFLLILIGFGVLYLPWLLGWPGIFQLNSYSFGVSLMQNIVFLVVALWIGGLCTKTSTLRTLSRIADFLYLFVAVSLYLLQ